MRGFFITLLCLVSSAVFSQQTTTVLSPEESIDWSARMQDSDQNFFELVEEFDAYWEGREITPGCGYKPFKRWQWLMSTRVDENGKLPSSASVVREWEEIQAYFSERSLSGNWQQLGPILDDLTTRDEIPGVGRMNFIAFHPTDPSIVFAGAPAGGLWRSYDGGLNWISNTDNFPTLGVSSIAFDPINPDIVYIGTGDRDANDAPGMGVMKSFDAGLSWEFFNLDIEGEVVGDLLVNPMDPNIILAATDVGVFRSTDGAQTWVRETGNLNFKDMDFKPGNPNVVYATGNGRFYRSEDGGESWSYITNGISVGSRMVIAVTEADPERVYVLSSSTFSFRALYMSTDSGVSFTEMSDSPNILDWSVNGTGTGGQAWYDLCMDADPIDPNIIYVGGIRMKKSSDAGVTWTDINPSHLHVDQHHCVFNPHSDELFLANDGGLYRYVDNQEWVDVSHGVVTGQIYKLGQSMHQAQRVLSGFQDNGTMEYLGTNWTRRGGGDGFECFYDPTDENTRYHSIYYGSVYRSNSQVNSQRICGDGFNEINEEGAWVTPFTLSPFDENIMFVGLKNLWRTKNIKEENDDDIVWERISDNISGGGSTNMRVVEPSRASQNMIFISEGNRRLYRTNNALADLPEWAILSNSLPLQNLPVVDIEAHPTDSMRLWISFDKRIYESIDMGENWIDVSGSLPEVNINTIVYERFSDGGLYIGTDMGIYYRDSSMEDWIPFAEGFPLSARVTELEIYYGETIADSRIRAATYGRGVWESDLYDSETYYFPPQASVRQPDGVDEVFGDFELVVDFYKNLNYIPVSGFDLEDIYVEGAELIGVSGGPASYTLQLEGSTPGLVKVLVEPQIAEDEFGMLNLPSDTLFLALSAVPDPLGIYGPGGVGDLSQLSLWLMADKEVLQSQGGLNSVNEGDPVAWWGDQSGNGRSAADMEDGEPATYLEAAQGINGIPAISFNGVDQYLRADDIETARDFAIYTVIQADGEVFNEHGWMASAREANGFILHPWKDHNDFSANAYNNGGGENMGRDIGVQNVSAPHIYGARFYSNGVGEQLATVVDDNVRWDDMEIDRDDNDLINIRLGRDLNDRWGKGKISEVIKFQVRMFDVHNVLVSNYMGTKYLIDLADEDYFHLEEYYRHELAGIGRESIFDEHTDAQGPGLVRFSNPSDLDDGEYLLWAHDNAEISWVEENFPLISPSIQRIWGYESTGNLGMVQFRFYDEQGLLEQEGNYGLIVSPNPEFEVGMGAEFYPLIEVEENVWSANLELNGSGCFTIGTEASVSVEQRNSNELSIYPNPASNALRLNGDMKSAQFELIDSQGRVILSGNSNEEQLIDISFISPGAYFIKVLQDENSEITLPFIKE